ncbi:hypothetical protein NDU88_008085 [Pleurodeles waltl]|uniref:Uncharacterized protein n=1 Tax=Pleurodeles waltl TaxID=8319 RepID=A0AAV7NUX9_PLEWA|nr:hypothetical protein NDU88_008085 [Pleurodeles waltl]
MIRAQSKRLFHRPWPGNIRLPVPGMLAHAFTSSIRLARSGEPPQVAAAVLPPPLLRARLLTAGTPVKPPRQFPWGVSTSRVPAIVMLGCGPPGPLQGPPAPRSTGAVRSQLGPLSRAPISGPKVSIRFTAADT